MTEKTTTDDLKLLLELIMANAEKMEEIWPEYGHYYKGKYKLAETILYLIDHPEKIYLFIDLYSRQTH